jgi:predicted nucleic acid-binding protein
VRYLLDTNVVSETRRRRPAPAVLNWLEAARRDRDPLFVSVLVLGEVRHGVERLRVRDSTQAAALENWLAELRERFRERTIPVDREIAEEWGRMNAVSPVPVFDGLMAATAKIRGLVFVTRNVADVARTGVPLLNPWDPPTA